MKHRSTRWIALCALLFAGSVFARGDETTFTRDRAAIVERLAQQEAACYKKFAVNDCLLRARKQARNEQAVVQRQENAEKERARRESSSKHQQEVQNKRDASATKAPTPNTQTDASHKARTQRASPAAPRAPGARASPRTRSARAAPSTPSAADDKGLAERAARQRAREEHATKARERLLEKQRQAAEREQARAQRKAQRDASGRPAAKQLPEPG